MITGEERIREHLGQLYGDLNQYEGKPSNQQVARAEALGRELDDVIRDFQQMTDKELASINAGLQKKKLAPIAAMSQSDWEKAHQAPSSGGPGGSGGGEPRETD